jgi:hypothetical protein
VESFLHQAVNPILGGPLSDVEPDFENRALNNASRHLDWKRRFDKVLVPTVYSKFKWARQKLHPKEVLSAVPVDGVQSKITGGIVQHFLKMPIPGKIRSHIL